MGLNDTFGIILNRQKDGRRKKKENDHEETFYGWVYKTETYLDQFHHSGHLPG